MAGEEKVVAGESESRGFQPKKEPSIWPGDFGGGCPCSK